MERIKMTSEQFAKYLNEVKGCTIINVFALTDANMYLKGNPFRGRVKKLNAIRKQFNYDYVTAVNNRLEKMGKERSFRGESLPWGKWCADMRNKVIVHKDELYMRTYNMRNAAEHTIYYLDGHKVTPQEWEELKVWIKPESTSEKQEDAGLEDEYQVKPKNYKFCNLLAVSINGARIYIQD